MVDKDAEALPAAHAHRFMWLRDHYFGGDGVGAVPMLFRIRGGLRVEDLEGALDDLVARHVGLRTTFTWADRGLKQVIHPAGRTPLKLDRLDCSEEGDPEKAAHQQVRAYLRGDLDLSVSPVRAALWHLADDDHLFVLDPHHIITDAWSNMLLARDLAAFYRARRQEAPAELPAVTWQYADFSARQRAQLLGTDVGKHSAYHLNLLRDVRFPPLPALPPQPGRRRSLSANEWFDLPDGQLAALRQIARDERTTLFVVLLSLFFTTIHEITQEPDIAIGTIVANRARREVQETVGLFANMLMVRTSMSQEASIRDTIRAVRRSVLEGLPHAEFPYMCLPPNSWRKGAKGEPRDVVFHMLAEPPTSRAEQRVDFGGLDVRQHHIPDGLGCRFEFEMLILPAPAGLQGLIRYASDRFTPEYARDVIRRYLAALTALTGDQASPVPAGTGTAAPVPAMTPID